VPGPAPSDDWEEQTSAADFNDEPDKLASPGRVPKPCLTVLTGTASGQVFKLALGTSVLGRASTCEVRVDDEGISRQHAQVRHDNGRAWLEDMASRNGTFVNGIKLMAPTELHQGDKIQLGRATVVRFGFHDDLDDSFHENLISSALRDGLTKLFNKRYLMDRLDSELKFALRHQTALSLVLIDLDHFKKINDTRGHLAGDVTLANVAAALAKTIRNEDIIARYGGEEIAVVLRAIGMDAAVHTAERLRKIVESTVIPFDGSEIKITASLGVANYPTISVKSVDDLVAAADKALYRAKHAGRNRVSR
jgi:diguanylate cyclase (GGDEF)-like protein